MRVSGNSPLNESGRANQGVGLAHTPQLLAQGKQATHTRNDPPRSLAHHLLSLARSVSLSRRKGAGMHAPTHTQLTKLDRPRSTRSSSDSETATQTSHSPRIDRRTTSHGNTREGGWDGGARDKETVTRRSGRCAACGGRVRSAIAGLDDDGTSDEVGGSKRATKRARRAGGALTVALGTLGLLCAPTAAQASPLPLETAPSLPSSRPASTFDSPRPAPPTTTPAPRPRPTLRQRIVPMLSWSDGDWVEDYGWTRWGLKPTSTPALEGEEGAGHVTDGDEDAELQYAPATAMGDAVASSSSSPALSISRSAASASPTPTTTSTPSPNPTLPFRARYSAKIPPGWTPQERETNYYAVPIIIAMSVLVAVIVVASIVVSVVVRRRKKRRREKRRERRRARKEGAAPGEGDGAAVVEEKTLQTKEREKGWRGVMGRVEDGLRRRNKGKKKAQHEGGEREDGGVEEAPPATTRRRIVRTTGFAAGDRVRPRRRRRRAAGGGDDDEDDEGTALTRTGTSSTTSSIVNDTLTARVAARLRRQDSAGSAARRTGGAGTTTVFSRDVNAQSAVSLTASALSRVSSRASGSSRRLPASSASSGAGVEQPTILFTPADDATLPAHLPLPGSSVPPSPSLTPTPSLSRPLQPQPPIPSSPTTPTTPAAADPSTSAFYRSLIVSDDSLPAPGPPAYRPSGSTVQATRRFGAGDAGAGGGQQGRLRRGVFGRERERGGAREEDEGEWYWPGEKGRTPFIGAESSTSSAAPAPPPEPAPESTPADEDDPPVDRSLFTAHIATDDKAVLARLRAQRDVVLADQEDAGAVAGPSSSLPEPSAPTPEEDDAEVDADGFERYDLAEVGASPFDGDSSPAVSSSSTLLPAPPQRVHQPSLGARSGSTIPLLSSTSTASTPLASPFLPPSSPTEKAALADSYAAAAEEGEDDALPLYLAGSGQSGAREALALASAPPGSDEDEDDGGWTREVVRNEGEREEEGIV